jgi:hypothetical protein
MHHSKSGIIPRAVVDSAEGIAADWLHNPKETKTKFIKRTERLRIFEL